MEEERQLCLDRYVDFKVLDLGALSVLNADVTPGCDRQGVARWPL